MAALPVLGNLAGFCDSALAILVAALEAVAMLVGTQSVVNSTLWSDFKYDVRPILCVAVWLA